MLRKQGELGPDGTPVRQPRQPQAPRTKEERTSFGQFLREVRGELRKVAWPTRSETVNYSIIVAVTLVVMTAFTFAVDWVFSEAVLKLFDV